MKNSLFDSHVKEQLGSYRPEVPPHIWENIMAEKSRKKPLGFWGRLRSLQIAAALIFLAGGAGFIYLVNHSAHTGVDPAPSGVTVSVTKGQSAPPVRIVPGKNKSADETTGDQRLNVEPANDLMKDAAVQRTLISPAAATIFLTPGAFSNKSFPFDVTTNTTEAGTLTTGNIPSLSLNKNRSLAMLKGNIQFEPGLWSPFRSVNLSIPCPTAERDASGNKRYVELYAGPDYVINDLTDPALSTYLQQRRASTRMLFAFSAGIRYTKVFGSGMSIRSGLNYSRVNEAFRSVKGQVTQNVYITNTAGDTTGTYTVTGTQYNERTNTYRTIDIPITAGYEFGNGRLHANVNAGAMINISSKKTGYVLDTNGNAIDIGSGKQPSIYSYKTNAGVSLTGGVSLFYKLNENMHVMAEPYFRYSLSPVTQSALSLKQKYHAAGLRLGLRVDL